MHRTGGINETCKARTPGGAKEINETLETKGTNMCHEANEPGGKRLIVWFCSSSLE